MAKMRVHELAKELNIKSQDVIDTLNGTQFAVKNVQSGLEDEAQQIVRKKYAKTEVKKDIDEADTLSRIGKAELHRPDAGQRKKMFADLMGQVEKLDNNTETSLKYSKENQAAENINIIRVNFITAKRLKRCGSYKIKFCLARRLRHGKKLLCHVFIACLLYRLRFT